MTTDTRALTDREFEALQAAIVAAGVKDGRNQAEWAFDGNTDSATIRRMRDLIEDGDPDMPAPRNRFSGEWADDPQWDDLVSDLLPEGTDTTPEEDEDLFRAYDDAVGDAFYLRLGERMAYLLD